MKLQKVKGSTSVILQIFIQDSSSTTGAGLTGLTNASSGLTCYYHRDSDTTATAVSLVTMTVGTFTSSGFKEIDSTNMPGWYQLCLPNAAYASGATSVGAHLKGAANMVPLPLEIELTGVDLQDAVRAGLTALPNVASGSAGAVLTSGTGTAQLNVTGGRADADVLRWNGTAVATPATAGIPEVNVKNVNNVSTSSVTTVNANQGTTQPTNFTGTGASALVKSDMVDIAGAAVSTTTAQLGVNAVNIGGTAQTGRDIGASVLISSGTGTGQLDVTSGVIKANLTQILGTALTETAGQIAAGFKQFFNIASPTSTMNTITTTTNLTNAPTSGDFTSTMKTSLNAATPAVTVSDKTGFSLSSAGIQAIWDALTSALTTVGSIGKRIADNLDAAVSTRSTYAGGDTSGTTTLLSRLTSTRASNLDNLDAAISTRLASSSYTAPLDASGTRSAVGLATANLDTQLGNTYSRIGAPAGASVSADIAAVNAKTVNLPSSPAATGDAMTLTTGERTSVADALLNRDMSAVTVTNSRSPINALRFLRNKWSISSTTLTVTKEDDTTSAWTSTLTTTSGANPVTGSDPA